MIKAKFKKGNRLAWTGFFGALLFSFLAGLYETPLEVMMLFMFLHWLFIAIIIWGCVLALQAKNRSLWWLLLLIPMLAGIVGVITVVFVFGLADKIPNETSGGTQMQSSN